MRIDRPTPEQIPSLRRLWQEAFSDPDSFLDSFFSLGFSPDRCRCVTENNEIAAALYWLDMTCRGESVAYIYAVATRSDCRGRGLCRALMADTHQILARRGYAGAVLSPDGENLAKMYGKMGYVPCGGIREFRCGAAQPPADIHQVGAVEYNALRGSLLPPGGIGLGEAALRFLSAHMEFYAGDGLALAVSRSDAGSLFCGELLGDPGAAGHILSALGCGSGVFRVPGDDRPFAMFRPLKENAPMPTHLGFAFD